MKNNFQNILITISSLLLLAFIFSWIFLIIKSNDYKKELISFKEDIVLMNNKYNHFSLVENALNSVEKDMQEVAKRFVKNDDIPKFITLLESVSEDNDVSLLIGSINLEEKENNLSILNLRISGNGSWSNIIKFISKLDSMPYALSIKRISINKSNDTSEFWTLNADLIQFVLN